MNKYGTLTEFPLGIVRKARKLNIKDTRGTRKSCSLTKPTSSVAKLGGNMNPLENEEIKWLKSAIGKLQDEVEELQNDVFILQGKDKEPLVLTKEMEVKDE